MKHIAAYALLVLGGKESPSAADVSKLIKAAGCQPDEDKIKQLLDKLAGRKFHDMSAEGLAKIASMGSGAAAPTSAPVEEKKEEAPAKVEEKEEEEDIDMGGLFGDDY